MSATPGEVQVPVQQRVSPAAGQPAGRLRRPDRSQQRPVAELRAVALAGARRFAAAPPSPLAPLLLLLLPSFTPWFKLTRRSEEKL